MCYNEKRPNIVPKQIVMDLAINCISVIKLSKILHDLYTLTLFVGLVFQLIIPRPLVSHSFHKMFCEVL